MRLATKEDWWKAVEEAWRDTPEGDWGPLKRLIFQDVGCPWDAICTELKEREKLYGRGSKLIQKGLDGYDEWYFRNALEMLIMKKDPALWYIFQSIWFDAPDSPKIHSWTMWGDFCDLCSEGMGLIIVEEVEEADGR